MTNHHCSMDQLESETAKKVVESVKRGETSKFQISHEFIQENHDAQRFSSLIEQCYLAGEAKEGVSASDIVDLW
jgi:hypothetical protein